MGTTKEFCVLFWMNSEISTLQNISFRATYLPSHKPSNKNYQDMGVTVELLN